MARTLRRAVAGGSIGIAWIAALALWGSVLGCRSGKSGKSQWRDLSISMKPVPPAPITPKGAPPFCNAVGGSGEKDIWVMGSGALHFDGTGWVDHPSGTTAKKVVGRTPNDVYAFGPLGMARHWDGKTWSDVDLADPAVTGDPSIQRRDIELAGAKVIGDHVFVIERSRGWFVHDGKSWKLVQPAELASKWNIDLWGPNPSDLFVAVRDTEKTWMARCTGASCKLTPLADHSTLNAVSGTAADDVWTAGFGGQVLGKPPLIYHFDGTSWSKAPVPDATTKLEDIVAVRRNLAYAVGTRGFIFEWDGTAWRESPSGTSSNLHQLFAAPGSGRVFALGYKCELLEKY